MRATFLASLLFSAHVGVAHAAAPTVETLPDAAASKPGQKKAADTRRPARKSATAETFAPVLWDQLDAERLRLQSADAPALNFPPERR